jgi:glutamine synthetase
VGERDTAANAELKCCDGSANPYLLVGAVTAVATAALDSGRRLPAEVRVDPATLPQDQQPPRLPQSVGEAVDALLADDVLAAAMGEPLLDTYCAVRKAEAELFKDMDPAAIVEASRWKY